MDEVKKDPIKFRKAILDFTNGYEETTLLLIEEDPEPYATGQIEVRGLSIIMKKYAETLCPYELCISKPIGKCYMCTKESTIVGKKTIKKERKKYMIECDNDKEKMKLFEKNIDWSRFDNIKCVFCKKVLEKNNDYIKQYKAFCNKYNIFTYDYEIMKKTRILITKDLMEERFHPKNIHKFKSWGYE